jgi:hypothetical protein
MTCRRLAPQVRRFTVTRADSKRGNFWLFSAHPRTLSRSKCRCRSQEARALMGIVATSESIMRRAGGIACKTARESGVLNQKVSGQSKTRELTATGFASSSAMMTSREEVSLPPFGIFEIPNQMRNLGAGHCGQGSEGNQAPSSLNHMLSLRGGNGVSTCTSSSRVYLCIVRQAGHR